MKISLNKQILNIIFLILVFKGIFPSTFRTFSDGDNIAYYKSNFLLNKNSIDVNIKNVNSILSILKKYDLKNSPKKVTNKDGSTTFFYRRSEDEPKKNLQQIKKLIDNPPNMKIYQNFIRKA